MVKIDTALFAPPLNNSICLKFSATIPQLTGLILLVLVLFAFPVKTIADDESIDGLGDLTGGTFLSQAYGVSSDGNVVVGVSYSGSGFEAFRWTQTVLKY